MISLERHSSSNLPPIRIFKKFIFFSKKPIFFSKKKHISYVLRNLTILVAFYGKFAFICFLKKKIQILNLGIARTIGKLTSKEGTTLSE